MNLKEIKEMIQLMNEHGLTEIELDRDGLKIRLRKGGNTQVTMAPTPPAPQAAAPAKAEAPPEQKLPEIKSPMVGTFYRAPAPDAPPYVEEGQTIKKGQVLCIIEAMKLMNEIKSEVSGIVKEIPVKNGEPVEFDQVLFRIKN